MLDVPVSAGGGTRTLTLSRAPAPKAGVYANFTTPARSAIVPPWLRGEAVRGHSQPTARYRLEVSTTRRRRPALIALVVLAAGGCLALGWWQWTRFESTSGSFQNLGYALQWPAFAGFCVYAYRKFVRYEESPPASPNTNAVNEIPEGLLPERPHAAQHEPDDAELREYNAYLAELAKADNETQHNQNRTTA